MRGGVAALSGEGLEPVAVPEGEVTRPRERTLAALGHPLFRRYSAGVLLSLIGNWVSEMAPTRKMTIESTPAKSWSPGCGSTGSMAISDRTTLGEDLFPDRYRRHLQ